MASHTTRARALISGLALTLCTLPAAAHASTAPAPGTPQINRPVGGAALGTHGVLAGLSSGVTAAPSVSASGYVLADLDTGEVLAVKNPHGTYAPASTLKILTALTLVPKLDPQSSVVATWEDANVDGSKVGVQPGKRYLISSLFEAMLMVSGNDAALALATANGGVPKTVNEMNAVAARLGALDTVARTPNGLDAKGQLSSAYDLAVLGRAGLDIPAFAGYVNTVKSHFGAVGAKPYEIYTHNKLVLRYKGAFGVKNGYTVSARASFVGAAGRNGHRLIVSLMHADPRVWDEAANLLNWGFAHREQLTPIGTLDAVPEPPASSDSVNAESAKSSTASATKPDTASSIPVAPAAAALAVLVGFGVLRLSSRRPHRRRRNGKLRLPPI